MNSKRRSYSGKITKTTDPERYRAAVGLLSQPWTSYREIRETLRMDHRTLQAIASAEKDKIVSNQTVLDENHAVIGRLSAEEAIRRLVEHPEKIPDQALNALYGTSTDKVFMLRGLPTTRVEVTHTLAQDIFTPFIDLVHDLKTMLGSPSGSAPALLPGCDRESFQVKTNALDSNGSSQ
jgi:hypothetical protein